jgi:hypothetical protein
LRGIVGDEGAHHLDGPREVVRGLLQLMKSVLIEEKI